MVDEKKVITLRAELDKNVEYFNRLIDEIVDENTNSMDKILCNICDDVVNVDNPATELIEKYFLELTNCLYFMQERVEKLNIYDSLSKISYKQAYNESYMNPDLDKSKPTVAELTAYAEGNTIYEQSLNEMYNKAYRIIRSKVDAAQTMVQTLSKVLSKRINDSQLSNRDNLSTDRPFYLPNNEKRLNE